MARGAGRSATSRRTGPPAALSGRDVARALAAAIDALTRLKARFALVGGLAVSARSEPRFTADVDLAVSVRNDTEAENLVLRLQQSGWTLKMLVEQTAVKRLGTARFELPGLAPGLRVDLMFSATGIEREVVAGATPTALPGGARVGTATVGHLIAMKCLSESPRRLQDRIDLSNLVSAARQKDLQLAKRALRLIEARGMARRKNLGAVLDRHLAGVRGRRR